MDGDIEVEINRCAGCSHFLLCTKEGPEKHYATYGAKPMMNCYPLCHSRASREFCVPIADAGKELAKYAMSREEVKLHDQTKLLQLQSSTKQPFKEKQEVRKPRNRRQLRLPCLKHERAA